MIDFDKSIEVCRDMADRDCYTDEQYEIRKTLNAVARYLQEQKNHVGIWEFFLDKGKIKTRCSKCKCICDSKIPTNFCPTCGAMMDLTK